MSKTKFSSEVRERAMRPVREHQSEYSSQWVAIRSIGGKIGYSGQAMCNLVRRAERDAGERAGPSTDERAQLKALQREFASCGRPTRSCAPEVECIGKGKARQPHKFRVKVSEAINHGSGLSLTALCGPGVLGVWTM